MITLTYAFDRGRLTFSEGAKYAPAITHGKAAFANRFQVIYRPVPIHATIQIGPLLASIGELEITQVQRENNAIKNELCTTEQQVVLGGSSRHLTLAFLNSFAIPVLI